MWVRTVDTVSASVNYAAKAVQRAERSSGSDFEDGATAMPSPVPAGLFGSAVKLGDILKTVPSPCTPPAVVVP